ncbi:MAG: dTMP kinase [Propionibacteriaceae bacterium]|nr:dTMP kinase [Propionibacteriaceae bacterium]
MGAKKKGMFIVFEGGDGAGKSTQAARLAAWFAEQGYQVRTTFEPGDTAIGAKIREVVLNPDIEICPRAEVLLYCVDKAQHIYQVVKPALDQDHIVVCDRYVDSTIAYQGSGRVLTHEEVEHIAWWTVNNLVPDLTVLMDVPVDQGLTRKNLLTHTNETDLEFHERVRDYFLGLASTGPGRYLVVNGRDPMDDVTNQVREAVTDLIAHGHYSLAKEEVEDTVGTN